MQHHVPLQFDPQSATIAPNIAHTPAQQHKTGPIDLIRLQHRSLRPKPKPGLPGSLLGCLLAIGQNAIGRHDNLISQPLGKQTTAEILPIRPVQMSQLATMAVMTLPTGNPTDLATACSHQRLKTPAGCFGQGLGSPPLTRQLRGIDTDQPDAATILQANGVAIDHSLHLDTRRRRHYRTERQHLRRINRAHKKGAHKERLLIQRGTALQAAQEKSLRPSSHRMHRNDRRTSERGRRCPESSAYRCRTGGTRCTRRLPEAWRRSNGFRTCCRSCR